MQYINEINIEDAIIHILDTDSDEPVLSLVPLKLTEDLYRFIYKHLIKALKSEDIEYGFFSDASTIKSTSLEYLKENIDFVTYSSIVTEKLFKIMKTDLTIYDCDLLFVNFFTDQGRFIGILKMDYVKNFAHSVDFSDGKLSVSISPQISGLPSGSVRKCAFIKATTIDDEYDLLIVDKDNKFESSKNYFSEGFLESYKKDTERAVTKNFIKQIETFANKNLSETPVKAQEFLDKTKDILLNETVNTREFVKKAIDDESLRIEFNTSLDNQNIPENIEIDQVYASKKLERIRLKIDNVIDIYLDSETYNDPNKVEFVKRNDGYIDIKIKNVKNYIEK